ncbi:probable serine/threonine-protein kinase clkA [Triplophysa dalaica]|uniref:probable serine/threonine-protein kinase clkA n=1 Tax=Triplophysa dalaica TaxID=1582913 RepID=UPI0024DF9320|nr:probable serine/threonine-protein kinase clkA [Triplophysa dalaica]
MLLGVWGQMFLTTSTGLQLPLLMETEIIHYASALMESQRVEYSRSPKALQESFSVLSSNTSAPLSGSLQRINKDEAVGANNDCSIKYDSAHNNICNYRKQNSFLNNTNHSRNNDCSIKYVSAHNNICNYRKHNNFHNSSNHSRNHNYTIKYQSTHNNSWDYRKHNNYRNNSNHPRNNNCIIENSNHNIKYSSPHNNNCDYRKQNSFLNNTNQSRNNDCSIKYDSAHNNICNYRKQNSFLNNTNHSRNNDCSIKYDSAHNNICNYRKHNNFHNSSNHSRNHNYTIKYQSTHNNSWDYRKHNNYRNNSNHPRNNNCIIEYNSNNKNSCDYRKHNSFLYNSNNPRNNNCIIKNNNCCIKNDSAQNNICNYRKHNNFHISSNHSRNHNNNIKYNSTQNNRCDYRKHNNYLYNSNHPRNNNCFIKCDTKKYNIDINNFENNNFICNNGTYSIKYNSNYKRNNIYFNYSDHFGNNTFICNTHNYSIKYNFTNNNSYSHRKQKNSLNNSNHFAVVKTKLIFISSSPVPSESLVIRTVNTLNISRQSQLDESVKLMNVLYEKISETAYAVTFTFSMSNISMPENPELRNDTFKQVQDVVNKALNTLLNEPTSLVLQPKDSEFISGSAVVTSRLVFNSSPVPSEDLVLSAITTLRNSRESQLNETVKVVNFTYEKISDTSYALVITFALSNISIPVNPELRNNTFSHVQNIANNALNTLLNEPINAVLQPKTSDFT